MMDRLRHWFCDWRQTVAGSCWGSFPVVHLCRFSNIKFGIRMHPSHDKLIPLVNETEIPSKIVAPQMFMNEAGVSDSLKPVGISDQILWDKLVIEEFPDMVHGLTVGEDLRDHNIARDVFEYFVEIIKCRISDYFISSFAGFIFHSFIVSLIVNSNIQKESL